MRVHIELQPGGEDRLVDEIEVPDQDWDVNLAVEMVKALDQKIKDIHRAGLTLDGWARATWPGAWKS